MPASETSYFQIGGRILPAETLSIQNHQLTRTMRDVLQYGTGIGGLSYASPKGLQDTSVNAVNPKLRSGSLSVTVGT